MANTWPVLHTINLACHSCDKVLWDFLLWSASCLGFTPSSAKANDLHLLFPFWFSPSSTDVITREDLPRDWVFPIYAETKSHNTSFFRVLCVKFQHRISPAYLSFVILTIVSTMILAPKYRELLAMFFICPPRNSKISFQMHCSNIIRSNISTPSIIRRRSRSAVESLRL